MSNINLIEGTILELCNEGETRKVSDQYRPSSPDLATP